MTPVDVFSMTRSAARTTSFSLFHIDWEYAKEWSVDTVTKRTLMVLALAFVLAGSYPLITAVHGQQPKSVLEYEVQDLQDKIKNLASVPTELQLIIEHQKLEDQRYEQIQEFQNKEVYGFVGTAGSLFLALFVWALQQFGITIGINGKRKSS